jgi:hypothetical protein
VEPSAAGGLAWRHRRPRPVLLSGVLVPDAEIRALLEALSEPSAWSP